MGETFQGMKRAKQSRTGRWLALAALVVALCVGSIIVAGLTSLVSLAERIHPVAGQLVFWFACGAIVLLALYGLLSYARMPAALLAPAADSPEHRNYLDALRARLCSNPLLADKPVETPAELEQALAHLSTEADAVVRNTASTVFLSTALMQNGRLDGLIVLVTQARMIWRIARIYVQRPSPREMLRLYGNVGATAFVASGLESLDISDMLAPLTASIGLSFGSIPGLSGLSHLLVRCVSTGAANAFLTLRVGEVARRYCELTSAAPSADLIRRSATAAAVQHLGRIVRENGSLVLTKIWESGIAKAEDVKEVARGWLGRLTSWREKEEVAAR